jgi:hypothetical protein
LIIPIAQLAVSRWQLSKRATEQPGAEEPAVQLTMPANV